MKKNEDSRPDEQLESPKYNGKEVRLCTDGKYRWTYPMNMLTNPSVYITVCKIFGGIGLVFWIVGYIGPIFRGDWDKVVGDLKWWGVAVLVFLVISAFAYMIVAAQYGWKYTVKFTMDENGINHELTSAGKRHAKQIGRAVAGGGVLTGNVGRVGQGMMIANHTSLSSDFKVVRSIKPLRRWSTIKVNEPFAKNQIYTTKEDFDFVLDYIRKHCPKVKIAVIALATAISGQAQTFQLNDDGYFNAGGTDVMAFSDFYPEGHQGGVCVIMNGQRIATNGDIRLEATPGQWQPVPKQLSRKTEGNRIVTTLCYPDSSRHLTGFNPMVYPDWNVNYTVSVEPQGKGILVTVDLDTPVPDFLLGKVGFNLEFFPGYLFGKPWIMDRQSGIYPQQPNVPLLQVATNRGHDGNYFSGRGLKADLAQLDGLRVSDGSSVGTSYSPLRADDIIAEPYAVGSRFTSRPDDKRQKLTVESLTGQLKLYDGRMNHNNGWFVLRSEIAKGATKGAVRWLITPEVDVDWHYQPVIQTSQTGYQTQQQKRIVIETDKRDNTIEPLHLVRINADGETIVRTVQPQVWGNFLRYRYLTADLSDVTEPGLYQLRYANAQSCVFRIDDDVYGRGVWQPVVEYFLPVQMCHVRVSEKYRIWHDACHMDDALMARAGNHIDGYVQPPGLSKYAEGERVPGVNVGGWHDAGDFDLRVESQAGEAYILALTYEQFHPDIDVTAIDQERHRVEIHEPDGRNDILQQVENGVLTVVRTYQALGRLYRGIICNSLRQYAMLGDAAAMTDGVAGNADDRWIFTENNPMRDLSTAAQLAGAARVLRGFNDTLSEECLQIAKDVYQQTEASGFMVSLKLQAAVELYLTTGEQTYLDFIMNQQETIARGIARTGWFMARIAKQLETKKDKRSKAFVASFRNALASYRTELEKQSSETPYGVPYRPSIWGAGWDIQRFGFEYYFLADAYPDIFPSETIYRALDFILGCHPGSNTASFASGVGAKSATVAYGLNRADWSYIPGGVVSGTALIRPDFPELLEFPFLWQQVEYVLGGGSSHYMFLVLAAQHTF